MPPKFDNMPESKSPTNSQAAARMEAKFKEGLALHQQGRLAQAKEAYEQVLDAQPDHFDALHLLGVIAAQTSDTKRAVELIARAIAVNPNNAGAFYNHGVALQGLKEHEAALQSYERAIVLKPDYAQAYNNRGVALQEIKQHAAAVRSYDKAIALMPDYAEAYSNRGTALKDLGQYEAAVRSHDRAIALRPDHAEAYNNRGNALKELKRYTAALESYDKAIALQPDYAEAYNNRGNVLQDLRRHEAALQDYDKAIGLKPDHAEAYNNRGNVLQDLKRHEAALQDYDKAIALKPDYAEAYNNHGNALHDLKQHEAALRSYDQAIAIKPDYPEALNNRGSTLWDLNRHVEALASCDRALALKPDYYDALVNRANALRDLKRPEEALASCDRAVAIEPDRAEALHYRGSALWDLKRHAEALRSYDRALALKPDYHEALYVRGSLLRELKQHEEAKRSFERLFELAPQYDFLKGELLHQKMLCCDWSQYEVLARSIEQDVRAGKKSAEPFGYQAISSSAQDLRRCAEIYSADKFPRAQTRQYAGERYDNPRIRIGYLSGEFRQQATAVLIAELFELHDKTRFELVAFDNGWDDSSELRARIVRAFNEVVDITGLSDVEAAATIKERKIDILVNLNGYFGEGRQGVFAHKPAPVQVNYLGFPGTIGADYIDYVIADHHVIPPGEKQYYVEKVVHLPDTYQVNDSKRRIAERTPARAEVGLPESGFVFCCFNNNYKITPEVFAAWMRLLTKVEGSVLWLLEDNAAAARNLRHEAEVRGVAPERLVFAERMRLDEHLARHRLADLFLDTLPYNAHTTASDALWAGLPLLTCQGTTFPGRVAASLLHAVGLPELITHDLREYEEQALELAATPAMLAEIRATLLRNRTTHPLFDADRFRCHLESAYQTMWSRHQRGEPPDFLTVQPIDRIGIAQQSAPKTA